MKYTIEGFSQAYAMTLKKEIERKGKTVTIKIDCTDLVILRWFVDFFPQMNKVEIDGKQYAFLSHKKLMEDLPLIDISKDAFLDRMKKLVEFGILTYQFIKEGGTFSCYGFGENYINLVGKKQGGTVSNTYGVGDQTPTKNTSIINNSIISKENIKRNENIVSVPTYNECETQSADNSLDEVDTSIHTSDVNSNKEVSKAASHNADAVERIFSAWNEQGIVRHRELTQDTVKACQSALKQYTEQEIIQAINRYGEVYADKSYFFAYRWSLKEFLKQKNAMPHFMDDGMKWLNYKSKKSRYNTEPEIVEIKLNKEENSALYE